MSRPKTLGELLERKKFLTIRVIKDVEFECYHCKCEWIMRHFSLTPTLYCPKCGKNQYVEICM